MGMDGWCLACSVGCEGCVLSMEESTCFCLLQESSESLDDSTASFETGDALCFGLLVVGEVSLQSLRRV